MKFVRYKNPYADAPYGSYLEIPINEDITPEQLKELEDFLDEDYRRIKSSDRKYYRHNYSYEARVYDGMDYAYRKTPEWIYLRKEEFEERMRTLDTLTDTQRRRLMMLVEDKLSLREIARIEGANYKSVVESIEAAARKLSRSMDDEITPLPDFNYHYGPRHNTENSENSSFKEKKKKTFEKYPIKRDS